MSRGVSKGEFKGEMHDLMWDGSTLHGPHELHPQRLRRCSELLVVVDERIVCLQRLKPRLHIVCVVAVCCAVMLLVVVAIITTASMPCSCILSTACKLVSRGVWPATSLILRPKRSVELASSIRPILNSAQPFRE